MDTFERNCKIVEEFHTTFDSLSTIGRRYKITRERVRQLVLIYGGDAPKCIVEESAQDVINRRNQKKIDKFWNRMTVVENGCWEWTGGIDKIGYGRTRMSNVTKSLFVHHISYILKNGCIPEGMYVLHKCDNPSCGNPDHLYAGTQAQNVADREARFAGIQWRLRDKNKTPRRELCNTEMNDIIEERNGV